MFHKLDRLERLLNKTSKEKRKGLAKIIKPTFGKPHDPRILCDHLNFLYKGAYEQGLSRLNFWRKPNYKQLVTDVADVVDINWDSLLHKHNTNWDNLRTRHIEAAIVEHVALNEVKIKDEEREIPPVLKDTVTNGLILYISTVNPTISPIVVAGKPLIGSIINKIPNQTIKWKKVLAAVIYVHEVIRKE